MTRRQSCLVSMLTLLVSWTLPADGSERPNILYLYVDDMGWGSIGPNGQAARRASGLPSVRTPNIDELARRGVNFTRGYGCHVCSPARSSQQSGFHQGHTFADRNDPDNAKKAMRADDVLMGDALAAAGYTTGYWGKWGYGGSKDLQHPVIENVQTLPTSHGYQYVLAELHHVRAHTFFQPTLWRAPASPGAIGGLELVANSIGHPNHGSEYPDHPALQNHPDYPATAYCDDSYAFAALEFIRAQGTHFNQTGKPFFGLLAVQIPHAPFGEITTLPHWDDAYADDPQFASLSDQTRQWAAMVTRIDAHFGNLLDALRDPNHDGDTSDSIEDQTLVIFQSDNGGPSGKNKTELDANGGLRGVKGSIQEGGIRVPLVMRWPEKIHQTSVIKAGSQVDQVVDVTDLLPTFCELAGAPIPLGVDGVSIAPTLRGEAGQRQRPFIIHEAGNGQSIIRGAHKLVRVQEKKRRGVRVELYDLDADRAETQNLAEDRPDLVAELESLLLGERVDEPRGFANTYHHWTGTSDGRLANANHWSDYRYANAGKTYMTDDGPPRLSWVARMGGTSDGAGANLARAVSDVSFLALQLQGRSSEDVQTLVVESGVKLVGRNEIRLGPHSELQLRDGTLETLRWIDIQSQAILSGHGGLEGDVFNHGMLCIGRDSSGSVRVRGDYFQASDAQMSLTFGTSEGTALSIGGRATLSGELLVDAATGRVSGESQTRIIIQAERIEGRFSNRGDVVKTSDGAIFSIEYDETTVALTRL
ncbi:MAG: sulfatase-like hydrolase/transferase [Planctomycetota bacterium]